MCPPHPDGDDPRLPETAEVKELLVRNHRRFLDFLERRTGSREAAEDILQDAFVKGLSRAGQLREGESAVAWFYTTLRHALVDHWRRRGAEQRALERAAADAAGGDAPDAELMETVCGCAASLVGTLKPEYAEALRRVDLGGAAVREWAAEAGISPNNASVRLHRARAALRKQVERSCGTCAEHGCLDCDCGGPRRA